MLCRRVSALVAHARSVALPPDALGYRGLRFDHPAHGSVRIRSGACVVGGRALADPGRLLERWLYEKVRDSVPPEVREVVARELG